MANRYEYRSSPDNFTRLDDADEDAAITICPDQSSANNHVQAKDSECEPRQSKPDIDRNEAMHRITPKSALENIFKGLTFVDMLLNWYAISIAAYIGAFVRVGLSYMKIW
jgi:hypothetical protein